MNQERPQEDIPGRDGIGVLPRPDQGEDNTREDNGTGEEEIGGADGDEELDDLEDDAEGG